MNYYAKIILILFCAIGFLPAQAVQCYTLGDGDFSDTSNWSCGRIPLDPGDTAIISTGDSIFVDQTYVDIEHVWFQVFGKLQFPNTTRLVFKFGGGAVANSMVTFYTGAVCSGGNGASGLSFGSGGSGCDIYRPASGANPGVYPTVPGSYYNGCVWASYLPVDGLWTNYMIIGREILLEWSLHETNDIMAYRVLGSTNEGTFTIEELDARNNEANEYYKVLSSYMEFRNISVYAVHGDYSTTQLMNVDIAFLTNSMNQLTFGPNPMEDQFKVRDRFDYTLEIFNCTGQLMQATTGRNEYDFNTTNWQSGVYFMVVKRDGRIEETVRLMKN